MYTTLNGTINTILTQRKIAEGRDEALQPLVNFIQIKVEQFEPIALNFICTHNSRRSHLSQIWAQVAAAYYSIPNVNCYSGGTEETSLFTKIVETLAGQGFSIVKLAAIQNPIYAIKYDAHAQPIVGFSKKYDHPFNPTENFAAILTCCSADQSCPSVAGAASRIPITYDDPKLSDGTAQQDETYRHRSLEIATEMFYVFSRIKTSK